MIKESILKDLLEGAIEGGSVYWLSSYEPTLLRDKKRDEFGSKRYNGIILRRPEKGSDVTSKPFKERVTLKDIEAAMILAINLDMKVSFHDIDAEVSDVILQLAVFGSVEYG